MMGAIDGGAVRPELLPHVENSADQTWGRKRQWKKKKKEKKKERRKRRRKKKKKRRRKKHRIHSVSARGSAGRPHEQPSRTAGIWLQALPSRHPHREAAVTLQRS